MASSPGARLKTQRRRSGVLEIGDMLEERYRILSELGRGEMGIVYKGLDPALDRRVAIKLVAPTHASTRSIRDRFMTEALGAPLAAVPAAEDRVLRQVERAIADTVEHHGHVRLRPARAG